MSLEHVKYQLIQQIILSEEEDMISAIVSLVNSYQRPEDFIDLSAHSNISTDFDLDKLLAERPLQRFDMDAFTKEADDLEWDKSIEDLLYQLD